MLSATCTGLNFDEVIKIKHKRMLIAGAIGIIGIIIGSSYTYYRMTHFNQNVEINGVNVGGLNKKQATKKLKGKNVSNDVYLDNQLFYRGKKTVSGFSSKDQEKVQKLLKEQWTFWPSAAKTNYKAIPSKISDYRQNKVRRAVVSKLRSENRNRKKAIDAKAVLRYGKVGIDKAQKGDQYDVKQTLKAFDGQKYGQNVYLKKAIVQPLSASSKTVQREKKMLEELAAKKVEYTVQDTKHVLDAKQVLKQATYVNNKYQIDRTGIDEKIDEINKEQATLGKSIGFKTHNGQNINIAGDGTYGWAIKNSDATTRVVNAFEKSGKTTQLEAKPDIYGKGYLTYGTGYGNTTNGGIGNSYAEVSIADQHLWIYRDGKEVVSTDVVTGKASTHEDTPKGLWYVMYKESPSVLKGSESGSANYSVKVNYWAQFTNGGCGFHDASWRKNWASDAYVNDGSGGCVNTPVSQMKSVYDNLEQTEAVVVY
ncbi:ErfK YbiS YcfS YnhG family protein [Liquorilactobacillus sucicola DSM 21376 = JCM 15457]|uniref:ErfK YbiS YcfS YnhG family protein n=1 Tax=Liquorilactobacillus sucicola DSM 21376 = JCM 15457 TaxID=1423806 RepID=A0A0R2DQT7_9LACO|nr:ErfK YbiS YcfS YnhG family protein [Liquorilactobacillus sucicola DSM 21376 = JCM 15457]